MKMLFFSTDYASNNLRLTFNTKRASGTFDPLSRLDRASKDLFYYTTVRPQIVAMLCLHHSTNNGYWSTVSGNLSFTTPLGTKRFYSTFYKELYIRTTDRHTILRSSVLPLSALQKLIYKDASNTTYSALLQRR
jgi:hypothetical protein